MLSSIRHRAALVAVLLAGSSLLTACSDDSGSSLPQGVGLATYTGQSSADGDIQGTLEVQDNCLTFVGTDGNTYVPRWPAGKTAYLEQNITVDGEPYDIGSEVTLPTGGEAENVTVPQSCENIEGATDFVVAS